MRVSFEPRIVAMLDASNSIIYLEMDQDENTKQLYGKSKAAEKSFNNYYDRIFICPGISNTALADNVSVPNSKNDGQTIGAGNTAAGDGWSVEVGSDNNKSVYSVGDKNAISLRDNATIHIKKNAVVTNAANRNIGNFGTGANTIESPFRF